MSDIADELRQRTLRYLLRIIAFCRQTPDAWVEREVGKQLLRTGMGVSGNYWSCCRGRSDKEFVAKLGVAVDEADESVLWLTTIVQAGIRNDIGTKNLLGEGQQIRAILSKSHKTARENRRRKARDKKLRDSPTHQLANSPTASGGFP